MGVVYLARDTRLDREVAIKALPEHLATDPARLERFEREAKTLAGLSHPNVAGIHGVEEKEGTRYLVLEYVDGETLADRLDRGPLPVDEAIEYAVQIAAGVEAAHEAGVIHRDLKPANIKITPEGVAKVLDFGLARVEEAGSSTGGLDSPTMTTPQPQHSPTIEGAILGTAAYMSPEQARGRRVDKRTDVWSFGVVLYEMLVGASPFHGETATDSIGAVLHKDLDLDRLPADTPVHVRRVLDRCVERDKSLRYRDIGDVRVELMRADDTEPGALSAGSSRRSLGTVVAFAALPAFFLGALLTWSLIGKAASDSAPEPEARDPIHIEILTGGDAGRTPIEMATSPVNPMIIAWAGRLPGDDKSESPAVCLHDLRTGETRRLQGTDGADTIAFSPDGQSIAFHWKDPNSNRKAVRRVSVDGGPVLTICESDKADAFNLYFLFWDQPGRVLLLKSTPFRLVSVSVNSGEQTELGELIGVEQVYGIGSPVAAGDGVIFIAGFGPTGSMSCTLDLESLEVRLLVQRGGAVFPLRDGRIVIAQNNTLCVAGYAPETRSISGKIIPLFTGLRSEISYSVSPAGDLFVVRAQGEWNARTLQAIDREGNSQSLVETRRGYSGNILVSRDGGSIMVGARDEGNAAIVPLLVDLQSGATRRVDVPDDFGNLTYPMAVARDGRYVMATYKAFNHAEMAIFDPDRPGEAERLLPEPDGKGVQADYVATADGRYVLFTYFTSDERPDGCYVIDMNQPIDERKPVVLFATQAREVGIALSPDNRWLTYETDASGTAEIVARAFNPDDPFAPAETIRVTRGGGKKARWSLDGSELFMLDNDLNLLVSDVTRLEDGGIEFSDPRVLIEAGDLQMYDAFGYNAFNQLPDGRFVSVREADPELNQYKYSYVLNWADTLPGGAEQ